MTHILVIIFFACIAGAVFGIVGQSERAAQVRFAWQTALKFVAFALVLGWILYFVPL